MAYRFTPEDVAFLRSATGEDALAAAEQLPLTPSSRLSDVDVLRAVTGARAGAVLETAVLRRRARSKVDGAQHWLLTDDALQQATSTPVADASPAAVGACSSSKRRAWSPHWRAVSAPKRSPGTYTVCTGCRVPASPG